MKLICPTQIISDSSLHHLISLLKPELLRVIGQKGRCQGLPPGSGLR